MIYRVLAIVALVAFLVAASNGHVHRWLGLETVNGTHAGVVSPGGSDLRAVEGWAIVKYAGELCGFKGVGTETEKRSDWDEDPQARRMIAMVRKKIRELSKDDFCADAWANYGPDGRKISGLLDKTG